MSAYFISIDGIDGCGKSTQCRLLADWLERQGQPTITLRDPGGTKLGESLREILLHRLEIPMTTMAEMLLYMSSRAQLIQEVIQPALASGRSVVCDRFLLANVVYQGCGGGLEPQHIWDVGEIATGGVTPDLTFLLDLDPVLARSRLKGRPDRLESRGLEYMQRVRDGFLQQGKRLSKQLMVVDATQSIEAIHLQITDAIAHQLLLRSSDAPR
ncbi:MAG: dTMP kinase [Pirellulaceae bacterium]|nr:dTMP kinase [Pirellulaceae bacterium]